MSESEDLFNRLVDEAVRAHFAGWDFSYLEGRKTDSALPWDYAAKVREMMRRAASMLDMGTGGGELLASFVPFPPHICATKGYAPNVPIAKQRLEPFGVDVFDTTGDPENLHLPFRDGEFELVINRHESYHPPEVSRVLGEGGRFITQQVGGSSSVGLQEWLQGKENVEYWDWWTLDYAAGQLREAGFRIVDSQEAFPETTFTDIGAIVYYLRVVPWQVQGFTVDKYRDRLLAMHQHIEQQGGLRVRGHNFYIHAAEPN